MQDTMSQDRFQALVDQPVKLCVDDLELAAKVTEVATHNRHGDATRDPFSIVFVTETAENYGQQLYVLKHADLGEVTLFLVPLGPKGDGMSYEAVIT